VQSEKDWSLLEMEAGHDAMVTEPRELARILLSSATEDQNHVTPD
jgi:hypothetical protein